MPKYYVQSGSLQLITTASDPRAAAIWAVHRALAQTLPFLCDDVQTGLTTSTPGTHQPPLALGEAVKVSEQGFDRPDSQRYETLTVLTEWNQLLVAIERIERRMAERQT